MHRYQFYITFKHDSQTGNTAASKAILDCRRLLKQLGYQDYTIQNSYATDKRYLLNILIKIPQFFWKIKRKSLIAVQYPLLSGNSIFKYFIRMLRLKGVRFFCIVHDLDALRFQSSQVSEINKEISLLNDYDYIIVHNNIMGNWLAKHGLAKPMVPLGVFDYLLNEANDSSTYYTSDQTKYEIVYAGNLSKSLFIYKLGGITNWEFRAYGPNYNEADGTGVNNLSWQGEFTPDEVVYKLQGDFGLIWDGKDIHILDEVLGNYLRFNNPHKFSLYLAAGLPIIAPKISAVSVLIEAYGLGILINDLNELQSLTVSSEQYSKFKTNVLNFSTRIKRGDFLIDAVRQVEWLDKGSNTINDEI